MTVRRSARAIAAGLVAAAAVALPATAAADDRPWMNAGLSPDARADLLMPAMTRDEKFALMAGACDPRGHTGFVAGIPRLGIPDLSLNDGPAGVHEEPPTTYSQEPGGTCATFQYGEVGPGHATAMPAPIALAATFDDRLANAYGTVVGDEAAKKQNQVIFGPDVNVMRDPRGGRTFEAYGEDPYLASRMAVGWIDGLQAQHVIADVKHYAANNEESGRQSSDSIVDERTLREIELPAFEAAVKQARVGTVMAAYNKVDGTYMTENDPLLNGVLKRDWGFDGWVLTDYGAQHSTVAAANGGTDMELPYHEFYDGRALAAAVASIRSDQPGDDRRPRPAHPAHRVPLRPVRPPGVVEAASDRFRSERRDRRADRAERDRPAAQPTPRPAADARRPLDCGHRRRRDGRPLGRRQLQDHGRPHGRAAGRDHRARGRAHARDL